MFSNFFRLWLSRYLIIHFLFASSELSRTSEETKWQNNCTLFGILIRLIIYSSQMKIFWKLFESCFKEFVWLFVSVCCLESGKEVSCSWKSFFEQLNRTSIFRMTIKSRVAPRHLNQYQVQSHLVFRFISNQFDKIWDI